MKTLYKISTKDAINNFDISGYKMPKIFIENLIQLKKSAAVAANRLKGISDRKSAAIVEGCNELLNSQFMDQFPVDVFQTGSGTSTNMNANEVIATLASQYSKIKIHPNDDVNWGQSSNCVIPSVISMTNRLMLSDLIDELKQLKIAFNNIAIVNKLSYKIGRTHLQDAIPMSIAQEFMAFAAQIDANISRLLKMENELDYLPIGGTAIGTMITSHERFPYIVCEELNKSLNANFKPSKNKFMDIAAKDSQVFLMSILSTLCVSIIKIAGDLRLLASGPKTGFGEISFKKLQSGSSIMPGKVNPVMVESIIQVCTFVIGKNTSVILAGQNSPLQVNMMMPLIAHETIESLRILTNGIKAFREKGVKQITINRKKALSWVEMSYELITVLIQHPKIGYDLATQWVQEAEKQNINIRDYIKQQDILSNDEIDKLLDIKKMVYLESE